MTLSYREVQLILDMVWIGIANGNSAEGKAFDPTPEQYEMLCKIANRGEKFIKEMKEKHRLID